MKFDIIVGNPPYRSGAKPLWNIFVEKSLLFLEKNGYLCFTHSPGWRKPDNKLWNIITSKQIYYIEIHKKQDGYKIFNIETRYDWYVLQNKSYEIKTEIIDENGKQNFIDLREWNFLPNFNYKIIKKILGHGNIIHSCHYNIMSDYISKIKNEKFKYILIHAINQNGIRYYYSSRNDKGHFGISKIIFGDTNSDINTNIMNDVIIDMEGKYGMTSHTMAIPVQNKKEAQNIKRTLLSKSQKFNDFLNAIKWDKFQLDWRLFKYLKKDWWKEFIDENE